MKEKNNSHKIVDALLGVAIGDALGVPFEFRSREQLKENPCRDMVGFGSHNQAPGTWSDDSSLTFCLAESLTKGYDLNDIAKKFILWRKLAYWTAHENVFDIGMTTSKSISSLEHHLEKGSIRQYLDQKTSANENTNGNGSLMRIIPLLFYMKGKTIQEQFEIIWDVSALTHGHIRAAMSCLIYLKLCEFILEGENRLDAYQKTRIVIEKFWADSDFHKMEQYHFERCIQNDIRHLNEEDLNSGGYVIDSLEASIWCFLRYNSYEKAVLGAINLGHDTDTTGAISGGLAGLFYGTEKMPEKWVESLVKKDAIIDLGQRLESSFSA